MLHIHSAWVSEKRTLARRRRMWTGPARRCPRANAELTDVATRVGRRMMTLFPTVIFVMNLSTIGVTWFGAFRVAAGAPPPRRRAVYPAGRGAAGSRPTVGSARPFPASGAPVLVAVGVGDVASLTAATVRDAAAAFANAGPFDGHLATRVPRSSRVTTAASAAAPVAGARRARARSTPRTTAPGEAGGVAGGLGREWGDRFDGLTITPEPDGGTRLTGLVADQSALYGLLRKMRDLGLTLLAVNLLADPHDRSLDDRSNTQNKE